MKKIFFKATAAVMLTVAMVIAVGCKKDNSNEENVKLEDVTPPIGGDWVDLGLPSGLLWATRNVGATSPEDYGDYFAWGETSPKSVYNWSAYRYCNGSMYALTKYCCDSTCGYNGFTDSLTTLQPEDDAATANWGGGARTPTETEWRELMDNTTSQWTTQNGVYGRCFTASNGRSIFLPAAGYRISDYDNVVGSCGYYWSSSFYTSYPYSAWYLYFDSYPEFYIREDCRYYGHSVRPVRSVR